MKILIALADTAQRDMLSFVLETQVHGQITSCSLDDAVVRLLPGSGLDVIVTEFNDKPTPLLKHLVTNKVATPCVLLTKGAAKASPKDLKKVLGVLDVSNVDELCRLLEKHAANAKVPAPPRSEETNIQEGELIHIRTNLLARASPLRTDIFIKLSAVKFVKIFQEGDVFDANDLERYMNQKKVEYFWLRRNGVAEFVQRFKDDLSRLLQSSSAEITKNMSAEIETSTHETVQELIRKLGPTAEVQEVVKTSVAVAVKALGSSPKLSRILSMIRRDRDKYISSHSMLLGSLACTLASSMEWSSEMTFYKLNMAAFLHDMSLENQLLAQIQTLNELDAVKSSFKEEEIKAFRNHTIDGSELVKRFHELPPDIDIIVAQHHERPDGSGFPRGLTHTRISPLAAIFIVAHDFLTHVLQHDGNPDIPAFVESRKEIYHSGVFKKALKVVSEMSEAETGTGA